ncbi:hypothetical protein FANTH_2554 [Fusarium anthophilum]|uniref:Uncharacterized protein n=1 Tax=Fusarium anthophilum TaxID=48485 RepID=A0A8H4ZTD4_9HYPO|nr:hypothetical protein FANTH_2554 [Fusarium anthophilum]
MSVSAGLRSGPAAFKDSAPARSSIRSVPRSLAHVVAVAAGVVISLDKSIDEVISERILAWLIIRRNFSISSHHYVLCSAAERVTPMGA